MAKLNNAIAVKIDPNVFFMKPAFAPADFRHAAIAPRDIIVRMASLNAGVLDRIIALWLAVFKLLRLVGVGPRQFGDIGHTPAAMVLSSTDRLGLLRDREFFRWCRFDMHAAHLRRATDFQHENGALWPLFVVIT